MSTIALAVPHTPWQPARVESTARLRKALDVCDDRGFELALAIEGTIYREFTDRAPNHVWALGMWKWLLETGADWCLQLQDDVQVAPNFWPALRAMLEALPSEADVIGLTSTHPVAQEIARRNHRWYRTPNNLVGWAYCLRREALAAFLSDRTHAPESFRTMNEDEQIGRWAELTKRTIWHPVPTLCDHDTSIPSSYSNDQHSLRRAQVTWRGYAAADLESVEFWRPGSVVEVFQSPPQRACWFCAERPVLSQSAKTGAAICGVCVGAIIGAFLGGQR